MKLSKVRNALPGRVALKKGMLNAACLLPIVLITGLFSWVGEAWGSNPLRSRFGQIVAKYTFTLSGALLGGIVSRLLYLQLIDRHVTRIYTESGKRLTLTPLDVIKIYRQAMSVEVYAENSEIVLRLVGALHDHEDMIIRFREQVETKDSEIEELRQVLNQALTVSSLPDGVTFNAGKTGLVFHVKDEHIERTFQGLLDETAEMIRFEMNGGVDEASHDEAVDRIRKRSTRRVNAVEAV